jgi:hypothetical protein
MNSNHILWKLPVLWMAMSQIKSIVIGTYYRRATVQTPKFIQDAWKISIFVEQIIRKVVRRFFIWYNKNLSCQQIWIKSWQFSKYFYFFGLEKYCLLSLNFYFLITQIQLLHFTNPFYQLYEVLLSFQEQSNSSWFG